MNFENINSIDSPLPKPMLRRKRLSAVSYYKKQVRDLEKENAKHKEKINVMEFNSERDGIRAYLHIQKLEEKLDRKMGPAFAALEANFEEMKVKFEVSEERNAELQEELYAIRETSEELKERRRQLTKQMEYLLKNKN
jgi:chromosome segregation ATPase